ncbi:glycosyltransferase [Alkalihalobacillus sp. 1P02AB]|uniref:glycosyltransferase n=1 Tax=Alkalihalobacillus sp. 1P02AB TaxID=3132260 RepID=UPI0039A744B0
MKKLNKDSINQRINTLEKLKQKTKNDLISDIEDYLKERKNDNEYKEKLKQVKQLDYQGHNNNPINRKKEIKKEVNTERANYLNKLKRDHDGSFFKEIKPLLDELPESNGSRYYQKMKANIGIISDEFLYHSFEGQANFIYITRDNYKEYANKLDIFLLVTTWKGLDLSWKGLGNPNIKRHRNDMEKIINLYKDNGIKTVFYSKEDPVNYDIFVELAKKCDYIFTTAIEKVEDYKRDCKNPNVNVLSFGINPTIHNPIGINKFAKRKEVLFAGSWYNKYPKRQEETKMLFDGVIESKNKLKIIDRNFNLKLEQYFFPERYIKYISPAIDHVYLQKLHKLFNYSLNLNSVKNSETMFANRVYELQALGNILISNYNTGINNLFPNVHLVHDKNEVGEIINNISEDELYKQQILGIRRVMSKETTYQRLEEMFSVIGYSDTKVDRKIAVVVRERTERLLEMYNSQTICNKELLLNEELSDETLQHYDFITFFNEEYKYDEFYLEDMINGFKYTDVDYVTKDSYYINGELQKGIEHDYVDVIKDKYQTVFWASAFRVNELIEMDRNVRRANGYSIDRYNFEKGTNKVIPEIKPYKLSVIIPTYNNGDHLMSKCFNSLKRSSIFNEMEIVIVDDGSTDDYTTKIISYLTRQYPNIKSYFFGDNGSGSASRPRNKGFEISTAPYITYLDPDNEAINNGYSQLIKAVESTDYDMVVGNMLRVSDDVLSFDYYKTVYYFNDKKDVLIEDKGEFLKRSSFKAMSIQALIVKREIISNNQLKMIEGAVGQDTLFFQELLLNCLKVKAINLDIHIYYAAVSGSAVNSVGISFFQKYFIMEEGRVKELKKYNLLDSYIDIRFEYYFDNWYLNKLKRVSKKELKECVEILCGIYNLYEQRFEPKEAHLVTFSNLCKNKDYERIIEEFVENKL